MSESTAALDLGAIRREYSRLIPRNFPDQGYDWRTPVMALMDQLPALLDALEASEAARANLEAATQQGIDLAEHGGSALGVAEVLYLGRAGDPVVLREHDAKVWDEGAEAEHQARHEDEYTEPVNPYRDGEGA